MCTESEHNQAQSEPLETKGETERAGVRVLRLLVPLKERYDYVQISEGWLAHYISALLFLAENCVGR